MPFPMPALFPLVHTSLSLLPGHTYFPEHSCVCSERIKRRRQAMSEAPRTFSPITTLSAEIRNLTSRSFGRAAGTLAYTKRIPLSHW
jgi:hypothetical protein